MKVCNKYLSHEITPNPLFSKTEEEKIIRFSRRKLPKMKLMCPHYQTLQGLIYWRYLDLSNLFQLPPFPLIHATDFISEPLFNVVTHSPPSRLAYFSKVSSCSKACLVAFGLWSVFNFFLIVILHWCLIMFDHEFRQWSIIDSICLELILETIMDIIYIPLLECQISVHQTSKGLLETSVFSK